MKNQNKIIDRVINYLKKDDSRTASALIEELKLLKIDSNAYDEGYTKGWTDGFNSGKTNKED